MIQIRKIKEEEIPLVRRLEEEIFGDAWSEKALMESLQQSYTAFLGAWNEKELVGYVILYQMYDEAEIVRIAVNEKCRRKGIAALLYEKVKEYCNAHQQNKIMLEVRKGNDPAIRFYEKQGFVVDGIRKNYYTNPKEDAILMSSIIGK